MCIQGEQGSAKNIVARILLAVRKGLGVVYVNVSIVHRVAEKKHSGAIRETIGRIERDTNAIARKKWCELYKDEELAGLFVAKVDVSEIPMDTLQTALPVFQRQLLVHN